MNRQKKLTIMHYLSKFASTGMLIFRHLNAKRAILLLSFLCTGNFIFPSDKNNGIFIIDGCTKEIEIDGVNYWKLKILSGIFKTVNEENIQHVKYYGNSICYKIQLPQIVDNSAKLFGYKLAVISLINTLDENIDYSINRNKNSSAIISLMSVTGKEFNSRKTWLKWWYVNQDYLVFEPTNNTLVIDENAKLNQQPISPLQIEVEISAEKYWYYYYISSYNHVTEDALYLRVEGLIRPGTGVKFKVLKESLKSNAHKRTGFMLLMDALVKELNAQKDWDYSENDTKAVMRIMAAVTDQIFQNIEEWTNWWKKNRENIVLSRDGNRLILLPIGKK